MSLHVPSIIVEDVPSFIEAPLNVYVRMLLIHGARALLAASTRRSPSDRLRQWAKALAVKRGHNIATVALANRLARIAWTVWREDRAFIEIRAAA